MYMASGDMTQIGHHVNPSEITPQQVDGSVTNNSVNHTSSTVQVDDGAIANDRISSQQSTQQQQQQSQQHKQQQQPHQQQQQQQSLNRDETSNEYSHMRQQVQRNHTGNSNRKRKYSFNDTTSDLEDDTGDDAKSIKTVDENKKQNHSEIEKRRRDKMNTYISELSAMVPMCHAMSRKLDKLTVLRMAVQHLKTIRGAVHSYTEGHYKPAFLSDQELKMLILQAADGFLFVVGCDRGRILYVSESVSEILNYTQGDLLGQSWFDILHPKDVAKVKEQLSSPDLSPRERLIDAKTMLPVKTDLPQGLSRLCPGARRSFFCRMKCKNSAQMVKEETETSNSSHSHRRKSKMNSDKKYCVIQCTGYLKSWAPAKIGLEEQENDTDGDSCNLSCLVAVGRIPPNVFQPNVNPPCNYYPNLRQIQFISRHAMDGKFLFVDQRATLVLGFLPQELLGTSMYEYYHHDDIPALAESHKIALQSSEKITTLAYRFRTKDNGFVRLQSEWKSFKNPWTKDVEYLIAKNSVILSDARENGNNYRSDGMNTHNISSNFDFFNPSNGREIHRIINSHIEASKIGRQIAEQVLDYHRRISDSSTESSPDPDSRSGNPSQTMSSGENSISGGELQSSDRRNNQSTGQYPRLNGTLPHFNNVRNNFTTNSDNANDGEMTSVVSTSIHESPNQSVTSDGNDEAAMAVIMSLLEADAGLGGPVDFTGLPWPLP
ncbi:protein cycle [Condylostylus longicornis]|uniref:protein cycle n=1 Tax=Condylostylus longicornis TaxID=2530218 RepID=UPI00244DD7EB|nr:protein cycle [Condylostylus longicornis]XP_055378438.1 protein cycle [Condylostylus longicornis]XP_055378439.1 protein cycle [Condylostylus longicornis]